MLFSEEEWSTEYEDFTGLIHVLFFQILATAPLYWEAKELHFSSSYNFINFFFFSPKPMKLVGSKVIRQKPKTKLLL